MVVLFITLTWFAYGAGAGAAQEPTQIRPGVQARVVGKVAVHVGRIDGTHVAIEPIIMPEFGFELEAGTVGSLHTLYCEQVTELRELRTVKYPVIVLNCEGGIKLSLESVKLALELTPPVPEAK